MKRLLLTCPFTGLEFEALQVVDNTYAATNPITGKVINFVQSKDGIIIAPDEFAHRELISIDDAADILQVSKARVCELAKDGIIKSLKIRKTTLIDAATCKEYAASDRKPGRRW